MIVEQDGKVAGTLVGYEIPDTAEPIADDMPPIFVPLQELENLAPGTWYVNVLAVLPEFRNSSLGAKLMALADAIGRKSSKRGMSVIVVDANVGARRLYEKFGYRETARCAMIKEDWVNPGKEWVLLTKRF